MVGAVLSDLLFSHQAHILKQVKVVQEGVLIRFADLVAYCLVEANLSQRLVDHLLAGEARVLFETRVARRSEAIFALRDAMLVYDCLRALLALESHYSGDEDGLLLQYALVCVHLEQKLHRQVTDAGVEELVADALRERICHDSDICLQHELTAVAG